MQSDRIQAFLLIYFLILYLSFLYYFLISVSLKICSVGAVLAECFFIEKRKRFDKWDFKSVVK